RRDAATLMPIIHEFILPGTTIYSDQWPAYNGLANGRNGPDRYTHDTVNHSYNFVNPNTLVHTQNIENMWMVAKMRKKEQMGQRRSLLPTHLAEFMWRRRFSERLFKTSSELFKKYIH
ncbi:unnamed protein product, partial [Rotaria sp. Silwood2]